MSITNLQYANRTKRSLLVWTPRRLLEVNFHDSLIVANNVRRLRNSGDYELSHAALGKVCPVDRTSLSKQLKPTMIECIENGDMYQRPYPVALDKNKEGLYQVGLRF